METTLQKIQWKDTLEEETVLFGIGQWDGVTNDDHIFYWIDSMTDLDEYDFEEFIIL